MMRVCGTAFSLLGDSFIYCGDKEPNKALGKVRSVDKAPEKGTW